MKTSNAERAVLGTTLALLLVMGGHHLASVRARPLEYAIPAQTVSMESPAPEGAGEALVDVNTATAEELTALPGIGEKRARAIVEYRTEHGPFTYVEDLIRVPGIGEGILEGLLDYAAAGGTGGT